MNTNHSDSGETESVVDFVRRGDLGSLESLFTAHRKYLRHVVDLRMDDRLRRRVDPSDIVQDAQVEALRRVKEYCRDPQLPVRLWMRQIAIDRLGMSYRQQVGAQRRSVKRELQLPEHSVLTVAEQLVDGAGSPSMQLAKEELITKVQEAVNSLQEVDREIILLQAFEGLNSTESAQVLGIDPSTARKRFGRALLRMKQQLVDLGLGGTPG